jgi:hypothetical protein
MGNLFHVQEVQGPTQAQQVETATVLKPVEARALRRSRMELPKHMQDTWDAVYTDTWEAVYIELGEPDDLTDMFFAALAASGYTGNERRFRHFFRALK